MNADALLRACLVGTIAVAFAASEGLAQEGKKKGGPPFSGAPTSEQESPRPQIRNWGVKDKDYAVGFQFEPGVPSVGEMVEITFVATKIPKTPHPKYGSRIPLEDADLVVTIQTPSGRTHLRRAHELPRASAKYGVRFTGTEKGIYGLSVAGKTSGGDMDVATKFAVDVWPLPEELEGEGDASAQQAATTRRPLVGGQK